MKTNLRTKMKVKPVRDDALEQGCDAFRNRAWSAAFNHLCAADKQTALGPEHLVQAAQAALLIGKEREGAELLGRAHQGFLANGEIPSAVRCAFWLGFTALLNGEIAQAGGWLSRASRLLEGQPECVERGYLLMPHGYRALHAGDAKMAYATFSQIAEIAGQYGDRDLMTLGLQGQGRALIRQGEVARGLTLLDEAMVAVTAEEVSPLNAGGVYCSVLDACGEVFDVRRAHEWTSALKKWCESQPDIVPYRGHCLVRRAEILKLLGSWPDALEEARLACEWLSQPAPKPALGAALYQLGEIHRLLGQFAQARKAYEEANQYRPNLGAGLARLRLEEGDLEAAKATIRRLNQEVKEPAIRALVLDAYVEIMLAAEELEEARKVSEELRSVAAIDVPFLRALSLRASGSVLLEDGHGEQALEQLRQSWNLWCDLQVPYEASRTRMLIAEACQQLGDRDNARLELEAARQSFRELGAICDLKRVQELLTHQVEKNSGPLTEREIEVIQLVASGMTNRRIATKLNISEKTVARHLSNIFIKLDLRSRSAATAYAYSHNLV